MTTATLARPALHQGAGSHPTDVYGLRLTTTAEAAAAYNCGLGSVLRVHSGAESAFREAVALDPGFALGYAGLALVGHEYGAEVDVTSALRAAEMAARRRCSERERSHVAAVAARVRGTTDALTAHLAAYPLDPLLVSFA
jgi:hypothetical protein